RFPHCMLLFVLLRRPRRSALFPYTTLFRSRSLTSRRSRRRQPSRRDSPLGRSSSRLATAHLLWGVLVFKVLSPVLGEQVVKDVVDRDRAQQVVVVVDDRQREDVVRRHVASHERKVIAGAERLDRAVDEVANGLVRRLAQQALNMDQSNEATGGRLKRRTHNEHHRRERGR